ncbi:hypothetical protein CapIbe_008457 [Capra ibex]
MHKWRMDQLDRVEMEEKECHLLYSEHVLCWCFHRMVTALNAKPASQLMSGQSPEYSPQCWDLCELKRRQALALSGKTNTILTVCSTQSHSTISLL